jgi:hypothetical protein
MSDVLLCGLDRKLVSRSLPLVIEPRRRGERPPPCESCRAAAWWNGWRVTYPVVASSAGEVTRRELPLPRAKCSCCHHGFTCYPPGFYPRRQYQLDVVADTVAAVVVGGERVVDAAATCTASTTSVRRWSAWIATLAEVATLHAVAAQLDPHGAPVATATPPSHTAAVLGALERLGVALAQASVALVERTGLGRVLGWQYRGHGIALGLVAGPRRFSPAMAPGGRLQGR